MATRYVSRSALLPRYHVFNQRTEKQDITERVKSITTKLADNADQLKNPPADFPPFGPHPDVVLAFRGFSSEVLSLASTLLRKGGGAVITCSYVLIVEIPIGDRKGLQTALPEFKDALYVSLTVYYLLTQSFGICVWCMVQVCLRITCLIIGLHECHRRVRRLSG